MIAESLSPMPRPHQTRGGPGAQLESTRGEHSVPVRILATGMAGTDLRAISTAATDWYRTSGATSSTKKGYPNRLRPCIPHGLRAVAKAPETSDHHLPASSTDPLASNRRTKHPHLPTASACQTKRCTGTASLGGVRCRRWTLHECLAHSKTCDWPPGQKVLARGWVSQYDPAS